MLGPTEFDDVPPPPPGWGSGASRRFLALAGGRAVAQVLGMVWFLVAARLLSDADFGVVAAGLAFFAIFAGIGDLGTTRTVVRFVAADHATLWPVYTRCLGLRLAGGVVVGLATTAVIAVLPVPVSPIVVLLAGAMATASGATELGYAALRAVGRINVELILLVVERGLFLAIGLAVVVRGGGPVAVLVVYTCTNLFTAVVVGIATFRARPPTAVEPPSLTDREARFTAAGFALVTVGPRVGPLLLALFASTTAVGGFAVAQRPIEAMTLFALSTAAPVLPIVRSRITGGRRTEAEHAAVSVAGAIAVALMPLLVWFVVAPTVVIDLFFGADRYPGAEVVLQILALTALTWSFRGVGEFVLLAEERARTFLAVAGTGTLLTVVVGIPLVISREATGAAAAVLGAEVVMTLLLLRAAPALGDRRALRAYAPAAALGLIGAVAFVPTRTSVPASVAVLLVLLVPAALLALRLVRQLEAA